MTTVVLIALGAWLVLSALVAGACALVARGGLREDRRRGYLGERDGTPAVPRPRTGVR